jgi:hypothetical protein
VIDSPPIRLQPEEFHRAWATAQWGSIMVVTFDPIAHAVSSQERLFNPVTGEDIPFENLPWNRHKKAARPPQTVGRIDALDPMAAFIAARDLIRQSWQTGGPTGVGIRLSIFDGRHRYDVVIKRESAKDEDLHGVIHRVVPVTVKTEPTGGFEADMAKHTREGEGRVLFSADARFLPLQVIVANSLGTGVFNLTADCAKDSVPCDALAAESRILDKEQPSIPH